MCMIQPDWFVRMQGGDLKYAKSHISQNKLTYDARQTSDELKVYSGFAAIHYAVLNSHFDLLQFLLPFEISAVTQHQTKVYQGQKEIIIEKSSVLQLSLLINNLVALQLILDFVSNAPLEVKKLQNSYLAACQFNQKEAVLILQNPLFIEELFLINAVEFAIEFNNIFVLKALEHFLKADFQVQKIQKMLLNVTEGTNLLQKAICSDCDEAFKVKIYQLVKHSYKEAKTQKWMLHTFLAGFSEEEIFGEAIQ